MTNAPPSKAWSRLIDQRTVWRWHFYAGLFCVPFVIVLAITGAIYLFKPQAQAWFERPFDHLAITGAPTSANAQVAAAIAATPGARLKAYEVRPDSDDAARVIVSAGEGDVTVFLHPETLEVLKVLPEQDRLMEIAKTIHGELLLGENGALLVELAASWAILMILSGLYLWWPRQARGLAGVIYPRLHSGPSVFWRDIHAVVGVWISSLALFLLLTGLPWTNVWNAGFKEMRRVTGTAVARQDWTQSRAAERAADHAEHAAVGGAHPPAASIDRMATTVRALGLPPPVLIVPPSEAGSRRGAPVWTARSDTPNRPLRVTLTLDPATGAVLKREDFAARHPIDQAIGYGIAAHEGQLFGLANQLLGVATALGLITLSVSGYLMWWRRRPADALGAPPPLTVGRPNPALGAVAIFLALFLPLLGLSALVVLAFERAVLRRIPPVAVWLGLRPPAVS